MNFPRIFQISKVYLGDGGELPNKGSFTGLKISPENSSEKVLGNGFLGNRFSITHMIAPIIPNTTTTAGSDCEVGCPFQISQNLKILRIEYLIALTKDSIEKLRKGTP